ncbi:MAG: LysR family transcriptional regulator, partial [Clostridium sp.]
IDSLRYFYNVALSKSISTVAKQSHISQSALSQQLAKLENKLDVKLLYRSNKGVTLTPEGEILFKHCETILNTYQKLEDEISSSSLEQNYISIEAIESLASTIIPPAILKLKNSFIDYNINLSSVHHCTTTNLLNNICDISLCYKKPDDNEGLVINHIGSDDIVLVADTSFYKNSLTLDELLTTPFIEFSTKNTLNLTITEKLTDLIPGFNGFNVLYTTNSCFSGLRGLKSCRAVTFIPKSIYNSYYLTSSLKLIHVENFKLDLPIYICYYDSFYKLNSNFIKSFKNIIKGFL